MEHRALAGLIIRIAGLLIIVSTITNAARSFGPLFHAETVQKVGAGLLLASGFVSVVIPIIVGLILIYLPGTIASRVLRIEGLESGSESNIVPLQRVAFGAIGLWLTVYAILDAIYVYAKARIYFRFLEDMPAYAKPPPLSPEDFASFVTAALQLAVGLWLLLGNRGIANVISRLRG